MRLGYGENILGSVSLVDKVIVLIMNIIFPHLDSLTLFSKCLAFITCLCLMLMSTIYDYRLRLTHMTCLAGYESR